MRIAFVGKGGSGKTTLAALFAQSLAAKGTRVLAIDADINQHLGAALGFSGEALCSQVSLADGIETLKEYFRGTNPRISSAAAMVKTTPPGRGSRLIGLEANPIFEKYALTNGALTLLACGAFDESELGVKCYHAKTGAAELVLNHLVDREGEYVIVDMTAGADAFASGLCAKFDLTILVSEPTPRGLGVWRQYASYAEPFGIDVRIVGNKIESSEDEAFLRAATGEAYLASIPSSRAIRRMERGEIISSNSWEPEIQEALRIIRAELDARSKDWKTFLRLAAMFHERNAVSWANASVGEDAALQIDPDFSLDQMGKFV